MTIVLIGVVVVFKIKLNSKIHNTGRSSTVGIGLFIMFASQSLEYLCCYGYGCLVLLLRLLSVLLSLLFFGLFNAVSVLSDMIME